MKFQFIYPGGTWATGMQHMPSDPFAPPLGILYLSSRLEKEGHKVSIIDYWSEQYNKQKLENAVNNSDAIGISITGFNINESLNICHLIKEIDPDIPLLVGGPHITLYPEKSLKECKANIAVVGEAETTISKIVESINDTAKLKNIEGTYFFENKKIKHGKEPTIVEDLDNLPFPARHLVEHYDYGYLFGSKVGKGKATSILSSRGCPMNCRFCQRNFFGMNTFRKRNAKNVIDELKKINDDGYKTVLFVDDNFLADKKRAEQIMDGLIKEKMDIEMWAEARVNSADEKLFSKMKKAGFKAIAFGIDGGTQEVLDFYNKKSTIAQIRKAVNMSRKLGFYTYGTFIMGAPIETEKHFEESINLAKSLPLDLVAFFVLEYGAGSPLWEEAVKDGKITRDEFLVFADSTRSLGNFKKEEIDAYAQRAHKEFYVRGKYFVDQIIQAFIKKDFRLVKALIKLAFQKDVTRSYWGK
jgi:radical SAM superfamily enzyme YgiQ (UPF0313 family)